MLVRFRKQVEQTSGEEESPDERTPFASGPELLSVLAVWV